MSNLRPNRVPQFESTPNHFARFFADYLQAIPEELEKRGCKRVFLLASASLDSETDRISKLEKMLGEKLVGKKVGVKSHTPYHDILDLVQGLYERKADSIVSIGGSSYSDAAKIAMMVHASFKPSETSVAAVQSLVGAIGDDGWPILQHNVKAPTMELFLVPTTLSAAEYNPASAASNPETRKKETFTHPGCRARCVILDPELAATTPQRLWLGSGMRAVDHCVEALCTDRSMAEVEVAAEEGLRQLIPGLLACHADKSNVEAHGKCQVGSWRSAEVIPRKVALGASHAIGHQLGSVGVVAHGETSCILLPSVLRYNKVVNSARQERVANILWDVAGETFEKRGLTRETADTADLIRAFVKTLGLPSTLDEVGVNDEERLDRIAEHTLTDVWGKTNPREITSKAQVREILRMAA